MAIAIYARKSTESEDRQVQSLEDQLSELHEMAERAGVFVSETILESRSAKAPYTRPEFQRLIAMIEAGHVTGLMTWHMNRLARNMLDGGMIAHLLQTGKLEFILTPQRKYLPEDSALILAIENGMATSYVQDLSRAVKRGLKGKVERGWHPGFAPLGYVNNKVTHEIEPDPTAFGILREGWQMLLSGGYTIAEVSRELIRLGLTGNTKATRHKAPSMSVIYKIYSNPFYAGYFTFHGELCKGNHLRMVSMEDFELVQQILNPRSCRRQRTHSHPYAGMFRCPDCGCQIVGETRRKFYKGTNHNVVYTYYHCTGARGCPKRGVRQELVSGTLINFLEGCAVNQPSFFEWMKHQVIQRSENQLIDVASAISQLDKNISAEEQRLGRIRDMRINAELSTVEYLNLKSESEKRIVTWEKNKNEVQTETENVHSYIVEKLSVAEKIGRFKEMTNALQRGLIRSLGEGCYLTLEKLTFRLDPVIAKIATFGPLRDGSQTPKIGDFGPEFSIWLGLVDDILTLGRQKVQSDRSSEIEAPQPVECDVWFHNLPSGNDCGDVVGTTSNHL